MPPASELTPNQQAMLDLALLCDLDMADPSDHERIHIRHRAICTRVEAARYQHEVEERVRTRRLHPPRGR